MCFTPAMCDAPSALSAAMTSAAPPRRSSARTFAPCSAETPSSRACRPENVTAAPNLRSSAMWRKRFSKIVSVNSVRPRARSSAAMTIACASVGKPGYGAVSIAPGARRLPSLQSRSVSPLCATSHPLARKTSKTGSSVRPSVRRSVTSPPHAAAAHRYVAVSMRSGRMVNVAPCSSAPP